MSTVEGFNQGEVGEDASSGGSGAPDGPGSDTGARVHYAINRRAVSFREWGSKPVEAALAWVMARLGVRFPLSFDDPPVEWLSAFEMSPESLPGNIKETFAALEKDLTPLGFHSPVYHDIDDHLHMTGICMASYAHATLPIVARLYLRVWAVHTPPRVRFYSEFITARADGTFLWTLPTPLEFRPPPSCRVVREFNAAPGALFELHRKELAKAPGDALPARNRAEVVDICERLHGAVRDWLVGRGIFRPPTASEQRIVEVTKAALAAKSKHAPILAEIARLESRSANWVTTLLVLLVSVALFMFIGVKGFSAYTTLLMLVPVLFFHELGHYVAMRVFGYRDVRMFFIPGFGAAVTGRNYNVPGWKKVVVALAGPLPGIAVGGFIGMAGLAMGWKWASDLGLLMLAINGFNLVPILPLDGGLVAQTVLFARHPVVDAVFRMLAAAALAALGLALNSYITIIIAVPMLLSVANVLRAGRVIRELRREGVEPATPDMKSIPPALADRIIDKLRSATAKPRPNALIAQETLSIFESLNARPPRWLASTGIIAGHVVCLACTLVLAAVIGVGSRASQRSYLGPQPKHSLSVGEIRTTPANIGAGGERVVTVAATWSGAGDARKAAEELTALLRPGESLTVLGASVLVRSPATDANAKGRWVAELESRTKDVFVQAESSKIGFRIRVIAPSAAIAERLEQSLDEYFALPVDEGLLPPWSGIKVSPDVERARRTYKAIFKGGEYTDPAMKPLQEKIDRAGRRGDREAMETLLEEQAALFKAVHRQRIQGMMEDPGNAYDVELLSEYLSLQERLGEEKFYPEGPRLLAAKLGRVRDADHPDAPPIDSTWALSGFADRSGLIIGISYVSFDDPTIGAPALLRWLEREGCKFFRYEIESHMDYDEESGD